MLKHNAERRLSIEENATHLGISKETIYLWVESEKIPTHIVDRLWNFKACEVGQ